MAGHEPDEAASVPTYFREPSALKEGLGKWTRSLIETVWQICATPAGCCAGVRVLRVGW